MKLHDLFEAATSELYHFTRLDRAMRILENGYFKLAASVGTDSERMFQKPGKFYYLSTSRSKIGDYTLHGYYLDGVVFNLNGDWLNQHYTTKPVDYWERSWQTSGGQRTSESEDRVYSKEPIIQFPTPATKLIDSIHILYEVEKIKPDSHQNRALWLRKTLLAAKLLGIPVYVYGKPKDWLTQAPSRRLDTAELIKNLKVSDLNKPYSSMRRDYFKPYRELYYKSKKNDLSKDTNRIMWNLIQRPDDATRSLAADIHNAKSYNDQGLIKLLQIFRKLGFNSPKQYIEYIQSKWTDIIDSED